MSKRTKQAALILAAAPAAAGPAAAGSLPVST